jgi:hypothetical protein
MSEELLDLAEIAALYRCTRRHARDVISKLIGFPEIAPGSTPRNPLWLRVEVHSFLHRKPTESQADRKRIANTTLLYP